MHVLCFAQRFGAVLEGSVLVFIQNPTPSNPGMSRAGADRLRVVVAGGGAAARAVRIGLLGAPVTLREVGADGDGRVAGVDRRRRLVRVVDGDRAREIGYDTLVLTTGARIAFAGHGWQNWSAEVHGPVGERVRLAFEYAESEPDPSERARLLTFVVVGQGATAAAVAAGVAEVATRLVPPEFAALGEQPRVLLAPEGSQVVAPDRVTIGTEQVAAGTVMLVDGILPEEAADWLDGSRRGGDVYAVASEREGVDAAEMIRSRLEGRAPASYRAARLGAVANVLRRLRFELRSLLARAEAPL